MLNQSYSIIPHTVLRYPQLAAQCIIPPTTSLVVYLLTLPDDLFSLDCTTGQLD